MTAAAPVLESSSQPIDFVAHTLFDYAAAIGEWDDEDLAECFAALRSIPHDELYVLRPWSELDLSSIAPQEGLPAMTPVASSLVGLLAQLREPNLAGRVYRQVLEIHGRPLDFTVPAISTTRQDNGEAVSLSVLSHAIATHSGELLPWWCKQVCSLGNDANPLRRADIDRQVHQALDLYEEHKPLGSPQPMGVFRRLRAVLQNVEQFDPAIVLRLAPADRGDNRVLSGLMRMEDSTLSDTLHDGSADRLVRRLLQANVELRPAPGQYSLLHFYTRHDQPDVVALLLDAGHDPMHRYNGNTAFDVAAQVINSRSLGVLQAGLARQAALGGIEEMHAASLPCKP